MTNEVTTTPAIIELQEKWLAAKEAEKAWNQHRLGIETQLLDSLKNSGIQTPSVGSLDLEKISVSFGTARKWIEPALADLAAVHPHIIGSTLRVVYQLAIGKVKVDALVATGSEIGQGLSKCYEDNSKKPGFTARG